MKKHLLLIVLLITPYQAFSSEQIINLVTPVSYFVNHTKELVIIENYLNKYRQASIIGTSGIGKTQLVRTYSYEHRDQYDIIWFIDCNLDLNEEFLKLAKNLNKVFKANISEDVGLAKKEVMSYLSSQNKWLLVFDNLKINSNKKVQDLVGWEHNGNVVFCSQDSEELPHIIRMSVFNTNDSVNLATKILENENLKTATFLAKVFNGYPVMIVQGAGLLNKVPGLSMEEYKRKIVQSKDKVMFNIQLAINELSLTSRELLNKITLINNQGFSKQFLTLITDNPDTLGDDIYQLSKFMLISNVDANEANPIFEMHDVIVQKIWEINGKGNNKKYLEEIVTKLAISIPKSVVKSHLFREEKTVSENLEVILNNIQRYDIKLYKVLELNLQLIVKYVNSLDLYNSKKLIAWFNKNDREGKFKLWLMNNNQQGAYLEHLAIIGGYYRRLVDYKTAIDYYNRAKAIFDRVEGHKAFKSNILLCLGKSYLMLGDIQKAAENIQVSEQMFNDPLIDQADVGLLYFAKARLQFMQGQYSEALNQTDKTIRRFIQDGIQPNDVYFTGPYLLRAEILNILKQYKDAYVQLEQLYNMNIAKPKDHEIFGRIYTQMARSKLGLGQRQEAMEYIDKAIEILLADEARNPKEADYSNDPDLAASYVVQGDIFFANDNLKAAMEAYEKARMIYFYLYRERSKNVAHVSYLYTQAAKASCKVKDLHRYDVFGHAQVEEFGINHPNTVEMFEYCKQYNMELKARSDD